MNPRRLTVCLVICIAAAAISAAQPHTTAEDLDRVASRYFKNGEPGAAVLIIRDGATLLRKGYGMADLEQSVPMRPDQVFEIGSITKQFTASAILQLVEEGKIRLSDDITRFLPSFPTQGKTITIEQLLTHTSGIPDYTELPTFPSTMRLDVSSQQVVDTFKGRPLEFEPGTRWKYDNSGYILLGQIIEKVSGQSYAEYVRTHVFPRAGLTHTAYEDQSAIIPNRVRGYTKSDGHYANADYLSVSWAYAAGALVSTVDDLAKWTAAVADGRVMSAPLVQRAWTSSTLKNGTATGYGYGWQVGKVFGTTFVQHGGETIGFTSAEVWVPASKTFVAVLCNIGSGGPDLTFVADQLASYAIGRPYDPVRIVLPAEQLHEYEGVYRVNANTTRTISVEDGLVYSQRNDGAKLRIDPSARDAFFFDGSLPTIRFERDASGKITRMVIDPVISPPSAAVRVSDLTAAPKEIAIDPAKLGRYVGRFDLTPGAVLTISRRGDDLWAQLTGQEGARIYPRSETTWFLKAIDAQLTFSFDENGNAYAVTLRQGGEDVRATKMP